MMLILMSRIFFILVDILNFFRDFYFELFV